MNGESFIVERDNASVEAVAGTKGNTISADISIFKGNNISIVVGGHLRVAFHVGVVKLHRVTGGHERWIIDGGIGVDDNPVSPDCI